jgi:hypothetical protein
MLAVCRASLANETATPLPTIWAIARRGSLNDVLNATETSTQEPRHCGARRSLTSTVALWAGRIVLICIAGVVSILSGLSLVVRFFGGH